MKSTCELDMRIHQLSSLNSQSCIKRILVEWNFCILGSQASTEGMRWSFIQGIRAMKVLQFNFEECWTVLIHNLDKKPSHLHCYQVNDCQVTNFKALKGVAHLKRNIRNLKKKSNLSIHVKTLLLIKGGWYFCTKKIRSTFCISKNSFAYKRWNIFFVHT